MEVEPLAVARMLLGGNGGDEDGPEAATQAYHDSLERQKVQMLFWRHQHGDVMLGSFTV